MNREKVKSMAGLQRYTVEQKREKGHGRLRGGCSGYQVPGKCVEKAEQKCIDRSLFPFFVLTGEHHPVRPNHAGQRVHHCLFPGQFRAAARAHSGASTPLCEPFFGLGTCRSIANGGQCIQSTWYPPICLSRQSCLVLAMRIGAVIG